MKSMIALIALVAVPAFATPAPVACGTHEANIAKAYADMVKRGEASQLEALKASVLSSKAQVACGTLKQADACTEQSKDANSLIDATRNLIDGGMAPEFAYDQAVVDMTALIAPCSL